LTDLDNLLQKAKKDKKGLGKNSQKMDRDLRENNRKIQTLERSKEKNEESIKKYQ